MAKFEKYWKDVIKEYKAKATELNNENLVYMCT